MVLGHYGVYRITVEQEWHELIIFGDRFKGFRIGAEEARHQGKICSIFQQDVEFVEINFLFFNHPECILLDAMTGVLAWVSTKLKQTRGNWPIILFGILAKFSRILGLY